MKKTVFLVFTLLVNTISIFCQEAQDLPSDNLIYPSFYDSFSAEESWHIHREAYVKQLKAKGLTVEEIKKEVVRYDKQKKEFIARVREQQKRAAVQRKKADEQRALADIQRQQADEQRRQADVLRLDAEKQSDQAEVLRKQAEVNRGESNLQRQKANEQRAQAAVQRKQADEHRAQAEIQRQKSEELRAQARVQRGQAEVLRKNAEEWRNSFENILNEKIAILSKSSNSKPLNFKISKKTTLLLNIRGEISSGSTLIEIIDPTGQKKGELSLEHTKNPKSMRDNEFLNSTSGALNKTISDSMVGNWQVKITSQESEGTVHISVAKYIKPGMDD
jgi:hypothetical protein